MINMRLDGSARTSVLTLKARADEQEQPTPLIHDPWSQDWYGFMPERKVLLEWYEQNPNFQLATVIRSFLIDEAVVDFMETRDNPLIVELGAGFSTRYFRLGEGKTTWIELDLETAIVARRKLDEEVENHWFIPKSMTDLAWLELLPEADPENILFIAEGALMFAEPDGVENLFDSLSEQFAGATFIFDVINPVYIEQANEDFKMLNAPMQWGVQEHELANYNMTIQNTRYLLLEFPERWAAVGIDSEKLTQDRSGYVIVATLG